MRSTKPILIILRIIFLFLIFIFLLFIYYIISAFALFASSPTQLSPSTQSPDFKSFLFSNEFIYQKSNDPEIPRIIHQTYSSAKLPFKYAAWQKSCIDIHGPSWKYKLWTDADLENLVAREFSWLQERYSGFLHWINRVDLARYMILYKYGGFFIDLDIECLAPLDRFAQMGGAIIPRMSYNTSTEIPFWEHNFPNSLLGSIPRHDFWMDAMQSIAKSTKQGVENVTGSIFLHDLIYRYKKIELETADNDLPQLHIMDPGML
jgi:mannosyltransferase OCH1-like enzyme